jgi:hypothetical protein
VTSTTPAERAGAVARIEVDDNTVNVADVVPKRTVVTLVNPVPVIVTIVPPLVGPCVGLIDATPRLASYVNREAVPLLELPLGVVTTTSTSPAACCGLVA